MSWRKWLCSLLRKKPKAKLTPAEHAQNIRNAIPAACLTFEGLQFLKAQIGAYTTEDPEFFNALNATLPITAPSLDDSFTQLSQICDMIEDGTPRNKILALAKMAGI